MKQFFKEFWAVWVERNRVHRALRLLSKQEWSIEFLTALVIRAARISRQNMELEIVSPLGQRIIVRSSDLAPASLQDDNIFNHLDDEIKLAAFIREINRK
jgi:Uri superfamily endonuclease